MLLGAVRVPQCCVCLSVCLWTLHRPPPLLEQAGWAMENGGEDPGYLCHSHVPRATGVLSC